MVAIEAALLLPVLLLVVGLVIVLGRGALAEQAVGAAAGGCQMVCVRGGVPH